jgi:phosphoserine phosphatase
MSQAQLPEPPLCVDLDGTLIDGDTLVISVRQLARRSPWTLFALPFVLLRGRPALKEFIARRFVPDPANLSWRPEVIAFLREEKVRGRQIFLATAAHRLIAEAVVAHLGLFDGLVATEAGENMKGSRKAVFIRKSLGCNDFDYIGDSAADLPIFEVARVGYLVAPSAALSQAARQVGRIAREFHATEAGAVRGT